MMNADLKNINILPVEQNKRHLFLSEGYKQEELLIFLYANARIKKNKIILSCTQLADRETHSHICYGELNQTTAISLFLKKKNVVSSSFSKIKLEQLLMSEEFNLSSLTFTAHCLG